MIRLYLLDVSPSDRAARFSVEPRAGVVAVPVTKAQASALTSLVGRTFELVEIERDGVQALMGQGERESCL